MRKPYPLPKVLDIFQKMERFIYTMAVDLRKGYYHIPLDKKDPGIVYNNPSLG